MAVGNRWSSRHGRPCTPDGFVAAFRPRFVRLVTTVLAEELPAECFEQLLPRHPSAKQPPKDLALNGFGTACFHLSAARCREL